MNTNRNNTKKEGAGGIFLPLRLFIYLLGVLSVSLGIVLCKKCGLGISPISSIPFVLEDVVPISFGMLTMLFHFVNTALQIIIGRKVNVKILLQIPLAVLFGVVINWIQSLLTFDASTLIVQIVAMLLSVFFTALGMVFMVNMQLIQNPPDGTVKVISEKIGKELGQVKIWYDVSCVVLSVAMGFLFFGELRGFGIATIVSALMVGKLVSLMNPGFCAMVFRNR